MKYPAMKCTRRYLPRLSRLICLPAATLFFVLSAQAQTDAILPPIGGSGGGFFVARCPQGQLLTGFELRTGNDIDSIRPICVIAYGPAAIGPAELFPQAFGGPESPPSLFGRGLSKQQLVCPSNAPIVTGMYVGAEGEKTIVVSTIHLFCGVAAAQQTSTEWPAAKFEAPPIPRGRGFTFAEKGTQRCPSGLVAVGINGRSGIWLDAVGLICGAPELTPPPKALGRVKLSPTGAPPVSICDSARRARARNSPAAPGLEAQCRAAGAAGEAPPPKALGRVKVPATSPLAPPTSICDSARRARARNSPAAPGLEAQCRAAGAAGEAVDMNAHNDLAANGEAIANADPLSAELRNQQPEGPARRGFDIGMAAAEGQTAPGPGKDRIRDSLPTEERDGFQSAVSFSLERNRNADLAAKGAAIAAADAVVAEARTVEADAFYWLGFDIATGIFGDPALGALGNTATGPGSLQLRDSLSAAGQRGFNAAVKLHLSRKYKP